MIDRFRNIAAGVVVGLAALIAYALLKPSIVSLRCDLSGTDYDGKPAKYVPFIQIDGSKWRVDTPEFAWSSSFDVGGKQVPTVEATPTSYKLVNQDRSTGWMGGFIIDRTTGDATASLYSTTGGHAEYTGKCAPSGKAIF